MIKQKNKNKVLIFFSEKDNLKKRFWISRGNESYNYLQVRDLNDKLIKVNLNINYKEFDIIAFSDYQCGLITSNLVNKVLLKKKKILFLLFKFLQIAQMYGKNLLVQNILYAMKMNLNLLKKEKKIFI